MKILINILIYDIVFHLAPTEHFYYQMVIGLLKAVMIFGVGHIKGHIKRSDNITLVAEFGYSIKFNKYGRNIFLNTRYSGKNGFLFVNEVKIHQFTATDSEWNTYLLCFGNTSKDFAIDNMNENGKHRYVYDFSVDNNSVEVDDI